MTHRLLDLAWENYRIKHLGEPKRGSTGRGISPAYCDETGQWQIYYSIFKKDRKEFSKKIGEKIKELKIQSNMFVKQTNLIGTISLKY